MHNSSQHGGGEHRVCEPLREPPSGRLYSLMNFTDVTFKIINIIEDIWDNTDKNMQISEEMWSF